MTENSNFNDDNGAGQIGMTDDLFGWPGDGVHWAGQRCGRYEYRKVLMHSTNPDHLVPSSPSPTDVAPPWAGSPVSERQCVQGEQGATMTDEELLRRYRQKRGNPYLTLATARALDALEKKNGYLRRE
jgi:hypothetical protein